MTDKPENKEADHVVLRPERRGKLRSALLVLKVEGESGNTLFGYAKSLAPNGMFITTVSPKDVGEQFMICFELPNTGTKVKCSCRVMWSREYDPNLENEPGMGIMFLDMLQENREEIEQWIEEEGRKNIKAKPRFMADREKKAKAEARKKTRSRRKRKPAKPKAGETVDVGTQTEGDGVE